MCVLWYRASVLMQNLLQSWIIRYSCYFPNFFGDRYVAEGSKKWRFRSCW